MTLVIDNLRQIFEHLWRQLMLKHGLQGSTLTEQSSIPTNTSLQPGDYSVRRLTDIFQQ